MIFAACKQPRQNMLIPQMFNQPHYHTMLKPLCQPESLTHHGVQVILLLQTWRNDGYPFGLGRLGLQGAEATFNQPQNSHVLDRSVAIGCSSKETKDQKKIEKAFNRIFLYKSSIWEYPHLWKPHETSTYHEPSTSALTRAPTNTGATSDKTRSARLSPSLGLVPQGHCAIIRGGAKGVPSAGNLNIGLPKYAAEKTLCILLLNLDVRPYRRSQMYTYCIYQLFRIVYVPRGSHMCSSFCRCSWSGDSK